MLRPIVRLGAAIAVLLAACEGPSATLLVVVASDYDELDSIAIETFDEGGARIERREVDEPLPFSFAVARTGDLGPPLRITVTGSVPGGATVARSAVAPFVPGETRRLVLFLARACEDVACEGESTCIDGACAPSLVPVDQLDRVEEGRELEGLDPDAGVELDAGRSCLDDPDCDHPVRVDVGDGFACAIRHSERVMCWGSRNDRGQLGDGTTMPSPVPVAVPGVEVAFDLVLGASFACARGESSLECWGDNSVGQLGRGSMAALGAPAPVTGISSTVGVFASSDGACAQLGEGVRCWGAPVPGADAPLPDRCGDEACARAPEEQPSLGAAFDLDADGHTCARIGEGVQCVGNNEHGELGLGDRMPRDTLSDVNGLTQVNSIAVGLRSSCAVADARVMCWGANDVGQLGIADAPDECGGVDCAMRPTVADAPVRALEVASGDATVCARFFNGDVMCWGSDEDGAVGDGAGAEACTHAGGRSVPCAREARMVVHDAIDIGGRGTTFCAVLARGATVCWGRGYGDSPVEIPRPPF